MRRGDRRGFTILEAAVALAIIGMTVVGVLSAYGAQLTGAGRARDHLTALTLAESELARLRLATAGELASLPDSLAKGDFAAPLNAYHWQATSAAVSGEPDLYEVHVSVDSDQAHVDIRTRCYRPVPRVSAQ